MSEDPVAYQDAELERALRDLGAQLRYPPVPALAGAVRAHLSQHPRRRRSVRDSLTRRVVLYPVLAGFVILASVLTFSPAARATVASWFRFAGVQIQFGGSLPGPLGHNLNLGRRASQTEAQKEAAFPLLIPTLPGRSKPDEFYIGTPPSNGSVSLVYRARRGLPQAASTGAGLLITEFERPYFDAKQLPPGTNLAQVRFDGDWGLWLSGAPHFLYYVDNRGKLLRDTVRLAGNVLIWHHGYVTVRMEGRISEGLALKIARSMLNGAPR